MLEEDINMSIGNYTLRQRIGQGSSSAVWLADSKITSIPSAAKIVPKSFLNKPELSDRFQREVSLMKQCDHPFISHYYETIEDNKNFYVFIEYADNGDLDSLLNLRGKLPENMCRFFFSEMLSALDYLHTDCHIAHRDLKPQNILLDRYNNIRISDFGLSKTFDELVPNLTSKCGTPTYAAPEVIIGKPYSNAADIWSLGVILYQMATGHVPFEGSDIKSVLMKIISYDPPYPPNLSPVLVNLLKKMLCRNPSKRITIKEIMTHPWVVPTFVSEVMHIVSDIKTATNTQINSVGQIDPSQRQKIRDQLIFNLNDKMDQARSLLPVSNSYCEPRSLPSRFELEKLPSNSNLIEPERPIKFKNCRSLSNHIFKGRISSSPYVVC